MSSSPSPFYAELIKESNNSHIMLLYENIYNRNKSIIDYINQGLKNGCLCIYACVNTDNSNSSSSMDNLSIGIKDYQEYVKNGDLKIINFKPYYEFAMKEDLTFFKMLKSQLEYMLYKRGCEGKADKILVVADAACHLSENGHFKECLDLEKWWRDVHSYWIRNKKNITVICPHPNYVFSKQDSLQPIKNKISKYHTVTLNAGDVHGLQNA